MSANSDQIMAHAVRIATQQATDRLRAATEGKSIREKVTIPVNTARLLLAAADEVALMVDDEDRIMDWMSSGASARIARVVAYGQKIMDERFADGVFE
jgi:hypothetical protein